MTRHVAVLGLRYPDLAVEEEALVGLDSELTTGMGIDADEIFALAGDADVIIAGSLPKFTADVIGRLRAKAIVRAGIGVDNIDLEAAAARGSMWVSYVPDYGTEAVALHTLAMGLAGTRRLIEADAIVRSGNWGFGHLRPLRLPSSMTAGVLGFGRIGRRVGELASAVGFGRILVHDPYTPAEGVERAESASKATVLAESDILFLHAPPPEDGSPLIGDAELRAMRPESVIVNTSRGSLIDIDALVAAMHRGAPRIAAMDVFSPEPPELGVLGPVLDRCILSPHMAWYTEESQLALRRSAATDAARILRGETPVHPLVTPKEHA
jgi:D-3-phosphoglycerate dehydrogenase